MLGLRYFWVLLPVIPFFGSCVSKEKTETSEKSPVRVECITIEETGLRSSIVYSGTIQEGESSNISFSTAGTIKQFNVLPGDRVTEGQVIGTLDDSSLQSAYEIAKATLAQAQDAYDRMKILHDANSLPAIKWVDIQQKLVQAQNAVDIAKNALNDATLRAPFSGIISDKYADLGQVVAPGIPVIKLIKVNDVKAVISVPQNRLSTFTEGSKAQVKVIGADSILCEGILIEKGVSANPLTRAFDVKYRIPNTKGMIMPGMICTVTVEGSDDRNGIVLPMSVVLLDENNNNFVWLDSAGTARKRIVTVNALNNEGIEITGGLSAGDRVITKGIQKISNGTKVEPIR